ncbi:MAG TPA: cupredoxin domain-containing protein [Blastocatellia bacterium]|nr:cupredoxin domain-containing protein [Blastocatellia bacterium]
MNKLAPFVGIVIAAFVAGVVTADVRAARPAERIIQVTAKKFAFTPGEITVKKGEPVALEITSADVTHGFSLPDFNVRVEIKPGQMRMVRFTPDKAGQFTFACDVFCGSGHEEMSGTLTVTD